MIDSKLTEALGETLLISYEEKELIRTLIEKVYVYENEEPWDSNTKKIKVIVVINIMSNMKKA